MANFKKQIYRFNLFKESEKPVSEEIIDEKGEKATIIKNKKVRTPVSFVLYEPNREIKDDAGVFYKIKLSKALSKGMLSTAAINKIVADNNGLYSKEESKQLDYLLETLQSNLKRREEISKLAPTDGTEKEMAKLDETNLEIFNKRSAIQEKERLLYANSAENHAVNETIKFYVLNCAFWKDDSGKEVALFDGKDDEQKIESLRNLDDSDDEIKTKAIGILFLAAQLFWEKGVSGQEKFDSIFDLEKE